MVLGDSTLIFKPGETAVVPIGTKHRFFNPSKSETVELVGRVVRAHEGFEKSVHTIYGLAEDGELMPRDCRRALCIFV
jgi:mannose-6-phosphate isomerase-like protein (cupin superfamily)